MTFNLFQVIIEEKTPKEPDMEIQTKFFIFCENIRRIRKKNGLTQKEMAKMLCIGEKTLSAIENNKIPPRLSSNFVFSVSRTFNVQPKDLFLLE